MKKDLLKHIIMVMLIALAGFGMTSCGDDDPTPDEVKEALEGTWQFDYGTVKTMGYSMNISRNELLKYAQQMGVQVWDETLSFSGNKVNGAKYVVDGDTFYFEDYKDFVSTIEISSQTLKFTYDLSAMAGTDCTVILYYKRV